MSFYESLSSIGFINEKHTTVIIDFGSAHTKVGFAGENSPRAIIKSEVKCRKTGALLPVFNSRETDGNELQNRLVDFIYNIYFKHLLVNSKDRRVVIVENILGSSIVKKCLSEVLFKHYEVLSLLFVPSHLVALLTLGISTGLVVDIGYEETTILPIFEGIPILKAWKASNLASKAIEESLHGLIIDRAVYTENTDEEKRFAKEEIISKKVIEDIKVRCCFITTMNRSHKLHMNKYDRSVEPPPPTQNVVYNLFGKKNVNIPGTVYEMAPEVLFEIDEDKINIPSLIIDCILECSIDARKELAQNLVIIGGSSSMIGLKTRILTEVKDLASKSNNQLEKFVFKVHQPPIMDNCISWLGGSIYGCTEAMPMHSTNRDTYIESGCIYDWCNLSFNTKLGA